MNSEWGMRKAEYIAYNIRFNVKGKQVSGVGFQVSGMDCGIRNELIANWKA